MRFYKKGISPLIATLLLISVAVSIGTMIMSFGSAFYEERRLLAGPELLCRYMSLELNQINNASQICFNLASGNVEFTVTNRANIEISSFIAWLVGDEIYVVNITKTIAPGYPLREKVAYDASTYGAIKQVQLIPKIKQDGDEVACSNKKLLIEEIRAC